MTLGDHCAKRFCHATVAAFLVGLLLVPGTPLASARLYGQGLLWQLEAQGYPTSYLFGTVHLSDERVLRLPEPVLQAFDGGQRCLFELIVPQDGFISAIAEMRLPEGIYLRDIIGDDIYSKVVVAAGRYGISTAAIGRTHPYALMVAFRQPASEWQRRRAGWAFLDLALQNEARAMGKAIYPLETIEEQMAIGAGEERNITLILNGMIENSLRMEQEMEAMVQHYLRRDLDAIFSQEEGRVALLPEDQRQAYANFMTRLLDRRNEVMVERMLPHLQAAKSFVAIGAAHLSGKQGVLHLLEQRGFSVTRIY